MLSLGLRLLGIGRAITEWFLGIIQGIFDFCKKNPLLALFIAIDIALVAGCWWGYTRHRDAQAKDVTITQLKTTVKQKESLIDQLYARIEEYVSALRSSQEEHAATIRRNNAATQALKKAGEDQLAKAQKEAALRKAQRDQYFQLAERYRHALNQGGTPEERIAREEQINDEFIQEFRKVQ